MPRAKKPDPTPPRRFMEEDPGIIQRPWVMKSGFGRVKPGKAQQGTLFQGGPIVDRSKPWNMNEKQFNDAHRVIRHFPDVVEGQPARIQAWHGGNIALKKTGFLPKPPTMTHGYGAGAGTNRGPDSRWHMLSSNENPGTYFTDRKPYAERYAGPGGEVFPVEVKTKNPKTTKMGRIDTFRSTDPERDVERKGHDTWIVQGGRAGQTGPTYREGVVYNSRNIRLMNPEEMRKPLVTPVTGAKVRDRQTGKTGVLHEGAWALGNDRVVRWKLKEGETAPGAANRGWNATQPTQPRAMRHLDVIGGHRDVLRQAIRDGLNVPRSAWREDSQLRAPSPPPFEPPLPFPKTEK